MIEHMAHGGKKNGKLKVPHRFLEQHGLSRHLIAGAIRESERLGLVDCVHGYRRIASTFGLTWLPGHAGVAASDRWREYRNSEAQGFKNDQSARAPKPPKTGGKTAHTKPPIFGGKTGVNAPKNWGQKTNRSPQKLGAKDGAPAPKNWGQRASNAPKNWGQNTKNQAPKNRGHSIEKDLSTMGGFSKNLSSGSTSAAAADAAGPPAEPLIVDGWRVPDCWFAGPQFRPALSGVAEAIAAKRAAEAGKANGGDDASATPDATPAAEAPSTSTTVAAPDSRQRLADARLGRVRG